MAKSILINGSKQAVEDIRAFVSAQPEGDCHVTERKAAEGGAGAPTWIVAATVASEALSDVLGFVKGTLARKEITKIKLGELEVENPTAEDIPRLQAVAEAPPAAE